MIFVLIWQALPETVAVLNEHTGKGFDESYLEQENSPVYTAYWRWMKERGPEITDKPAEPELEELDALAI